RGLLIGFLPKYRNKFWLNSEMRRKIISILLVTAIVLSLFVIMAWPEVLSRIKISPDDEAIKLRIYYASETIDQRLSWFGSGAGNFTVWLKSKQPNLPEYLYQPVHNIYLLLYSELGILGLIAFLSLIGYTFYDFYRSYKFQKLFHYSFILVFASILLMGMFDHFLWTLQQGRFVLWLSVALIATKDIKFE
ncbi:MAG: O-antigen ligase-related protein, partial [Candidatus Yanofskybacteria bacterium GW2011_GWD2_39_48]